jgi:hypothetical protein
MDNSSIFVSRHDASDSSGFGRHWMARALGLTLENRAGSRRSRPLRLRSARLAQEAEGAGGLN